MRYIVCVGRRLSVYACVHYALSINSGGRVLTQSLYVGGAQCALAALGRFVCRSILNYLPLAPLPAHSISLLLCIYTQCMEPAQSIRGYWVHTPGPAAGTWTIGPETKALEFNSTLSPLAPHQISLASIISIVQNLHEVIHSRINWTYRCIDNNKC